MKYRLEVQCESVFEESQRFCESGHLMGVQSHLCEEVHRKAHQTCSEGQSVLDLHLPSTVTVMLKLDSSYQDIEARITSAAEDSARVATETICATTTKLKCNLLRVRLVAELERAHNGRLALAAHAVQGPMVQGPMVQGPMVSPVELQVQQARDAALQRVTNELEGCLVHGFWGAPDVKEEPPYNITGALFAAMMPAECPGAPWVNWA